MRRRFCFSFFLMKSFYSRVTDGSNGAEFFRDKECLKDDLISFCNSMLTFRYVAG